MYKYVVEQVMSHNISDRATYADETSALDAFWKMDGVRRIGVVDHEGRGQMLLEQEGAGMPGLCPMKAQDPAEISHLHEMRERWLIACADLYRVRCGQEVKEILEQASSPTSMRQEKINFKKEISRRMDCCKKVFLNHRMDGYDFREVPLDDAIFINCSLAGSNFSHVNLQNTVFVNCKLDKCVWHGAFMNNAYVYQSEQPMELQDLWGGTAWEK